ncbi:MAG: S8 family peptidase [Dehalococcoidia bacterium]|nr:S8 family peptidase [Dehalococcoidia bacterium]
MDSIRNRTAIAWSWPKRLGFVLAAALVAVITLSSGGTSAADNVHGAVYDWAQSNPGQDVPVFVQTDGDSGAVADFIRASGGAVQREFGIIPAVEADVPPAFVSALASHRNVAWVSLDAPVVPTGGIDTSNLANTYPFSVNANDPWSKGYTGAGVGVAVVDTGISPSGHEDFKGADGKSRVIAEVVVNTTTSNVTDGYGHGTHVAGIVGGDGSLLDGKYIGIAPSVNLLNVKVADDAGNASLADVIAGLEFVYNNKDAFNIRVVNLSLHSSVAQSYKTDPLCAAAEFLWLNGVFVVAAAGNLGGAPDAVGYCPGNDPFIMTVGAIDDQGTTAYGDDVPTPWSSFGTTQDGFPKPELLTPGRGIVSVIDTNSILYKDYPANVVDKQYLRLSGTSMSAGVMSGVAALVLERRPDWTPGQLKCTLISTSRSLSGSYSSFRVPRAGNASNQSTPTCDSDGGLTPSFLLSQAPVVQVGVVAYVLGEPNPQAAAAKVGLDLEAAGIRGATLDTVDWSAIKWSAIKWSAIKWSAIEWSAIKWSAIEWDAIKWSSDVDFAAIKWSAIKWSAIKWSAIKWSAIKWSGSAVDFDAIKWSAIKWTAFPE